MLRFPLSKIPKAGLDIELNAHSKDLIAIIKTSVDSELYKIDFESLNGKIHIDNSEGEIDCTGKLSFSYDCQCAHCGNDLKRESKHNWQTHLSPWNKSKALADEELELSSDDLDFSFYENNEIDLEPILNDEIALSFPYNVYCKDSKNCEKRFQDLMQTQNAENIDPRLASLKNWKAKGDA